MVRALGLLSNNLSKQVFRYTLRNWSIHIRLDLPRRLQVASAEYQRNFRP